MHARRSFCKRLFLRSFLIPLTVSCTPAPAPTPATPPSVLQVAIAPAAAQADPPFAGVPSAHVAASGCRFVGTTGDSLRLSYAGAVFAVATTPDRVTLTLGTSVSSIVFSIFGWSLDVGIEDSGVPLHAREPLGFAGVYDPFSSVDLSWKTAPTFQVNAPTGSGPRFLGAPPTQTPRCEAVGLGTSDFPERPRPTSPMAWSELIEDTELSATEAGPAVAVLPKGALVEAGPPSPATALPKGAKREIVYRKEGVWRGWVAAAALRSAPPTFGVGRLGGRHASPRRFAGFKCPTPIPLYLRRTGDHSPLVTIGVVRAQVHVAFEAGNEGYRVLANEQRVTTGSPGAFVLSDGYEIVVDEEPTLACTKDFP